MLRQGECFFHYVGRRGFEVASVYVDEVNNAGARTLLRFKKIDLERSVALSRRQLVGWVANVAGGAKGVTGRRKRRSKRRTGEMGKRAVITLERC